MKLSKIIGLGAGRGQVAGGAVAGRMRTWERLSGAGRGRSLIGATARKRSK